jgi:hypothetical protein
LKSLSSAEPYAFSANSLLPLKENSKVISEFRQSSLNDENPHSNECVRQFQYVSAVIRSGSIFVSAEIANPFQIQEIDDFMQQFWVKGQFFCIESTNYCQQIRRACTC